MFLGLTGKIIGGLLAVAAGVYFGLPGRDLRSNEEIEKDLLAPGRRKHVRRSFMPLDLFDRRITASQLRRERVRFRTAVPEFEPLENEDESPES